MSGLRLFFAEIEGSDEIVRSVVSQFAERALGRTEAAAPNGIPAAAELEAPAAPEPIATGRGARKGKVLKNHFSRTGKKDQGRNTKAPVEQSPVDESSIRGQILAALKKRPMTSAELLEAMPERHANSIYTILGQMRSAGEVETRPDDGGTRRNYLAD